ncbi:MAG: cell division protein FtsH [Candidatus Terrybacteria bacterium RIFCSPLOWO2_01_FULL_44_24]|uniref:ATP-dependent zinc metalloprotease FtsH n=1 Tax=Candidatus Terrybacteria bacterium RIFCSPHIGHO2_01_FULL_43_35 TaxID=1802361 RepID=A0A1G2PFX0_9BACT|nr:MAG: cell division protein FtsH [Candidatus Terrybacteria bacterium RIFCSPHIGHO2_01_FULL_43_35]OHA49614.1 MAG: cell division protein FtsH [Candidatus Terrybacteria bacterium RIFCSPHIGHO2_02_FULL_43_14]OHA51500.1 MAG: cell division protein FtsH [Candidatus Terrybacteria bacterium RIFCSPLOWO2_01_FULL_44_24]
MKKTTSQNIVWYAVIVILILMAFSFLNGSNTSPSEVSFSQVVSQIKEGKVDKIVVSRDDSLAITLKDGTQETSQKEQYAPLAQILKDNYGLSVEQITKANIIPLKEEDNFLPQLLIMLLPIILIGGIFLYMMRSAQKTNGTALDFGKSKARLFGGSRVKTTFADVAGAEEAKVELQELVEFLKDPDQFTSMGARIPHGILLVGPPGCGKTLIARAVAGEANVPFFTLSASEFVEMFVGVGASRVRDLFERAKKNSPSIIFIDEIDAVGRQRGTGLGGSHDEREQTLNQVLVEMDGFETNSSVIVIAATNRADILDPALIRPGRFDRQVSIPRPDVKGRAAILKVHVRGKPLSPDADLEAIAKITHGFSGADLENLVNEAAILTVRKQKKDKTIQHITTLELTEALDKVVAGPENRSRVVSDKDKNIITYHESGHALVGHLLPDCDPIYKITNVAHGSALGYTMPLPQEDYLLHSKAQLEAQLASVLAGNAAEKVVYNDVTTGASNDLEKATAIAKNMVMRYGMSGRVGHRVAGSDGHVVFLGRDYAANDDYGGELADQIDQEIKFILDSAYEKAENLLRKNRDRLDNLAQSLLVAETLQGDELQAILGPRTSN